MTGQLNNLRIAVLIVEDRSAVVSDQFNNI